MLPLFSFAHPAKLSHVYCRRTRKSKKEDEGRKGEGRGGREEEKTIIYQQQINIYDQDQRKLKHLIESGYI